jgi:hypothetical protein
MTGHLGTYLATFLGLVATTGDAEQALRTLAQKNRILSRFQYDE